MLNLALDLSRIPLVTRVVCSLSLVLSLLFWALEYKTYFSSAETGGKSPQRTVPVVSALTIMLSSSYYLIWTFITASFVSSNLLTLTVSITTLLLGGRYVEFSYSSQEVAKFYVVLVIVPNIVIFLTMLLLWAATGHDSWLNTSIYGSVALQAGILVAFKQLVPEHTVTLHKSVLKIRVKHFPILFVLITIVTAPFFGNYSTISYAILGFLTGWVYLRFYKSNIPDLGAQMLVPRRGDASETFALSQFFPDVFQAPIDRVATVTYDYCVLIGLCAPFGADLSDGSDEFGSRTTGPGVGRAEAERRRTLALRVLDERNDRTTRGNLEDMTTTGQLPPQVDH